MSEKYHVNTREVAPRFFPVSRLYAIENDGCLGCLECVKRDSCIYDVYRQRQFDSEQVIDTVDVNCIGCMRCVQECKKNILFRMPNPLYEAMGNEYWKPDMIASIWKQAQTAKIPVSGSGYRGPFAGAGFDKMWTDMSEIVRPTRDGIHGREYISTVIELGRRPQILEFDSEGGLITEMYPFVEIPVPVVLDIPSVKFVSGATKEAIARAAVKLKSYAVASLEDAVGVLADYRSNLIVKFNPDNDDIGKLEDIKIVQVQYREKIEEAIAKIKQANPGIIVSVRIDLDENAVRRATALAADCGQILHFQASENGQGLGEKKDEFITELIKDVHVNLLDNSLRDQVTILVSGGIAMAEHTPKILACGSDGVGVDNALAVAIECRICPDCHNRESCPVDMDGVDVEWAAQRIVNLLDCWHSQLVEVMGAMGIREVRRLRGELGRVMFFDDLEKESFSDIFGKRIRGMVESLCDNAGDNKDDEVDKAMASGRFVVSKDIVADCASRFRNKIGRYKVVRSSACIACGKCAEVCAYGVHKKAGKRMLTPKSHFCVGGEICAATGAFCVEHCPVNAIGVGPDPMWETIGDPRWTSDLLTSTWMQAANGAVPVDKGVEYKIGGSGGGFDRMKIVFGGDSKNSDFRPEDVDLRVALNRRDDDGRPDVTIGIPFYGGGMSYGSISLATMMARAKAYAAFDSFTCSGEGGYPDGLKEYDNNVITQIATGLFGVKEETIQRVRMVEFKYAQGAKPGLGGHLLGDKVTPAVAKMREAVVGSNLFSPFPFHSVYSVEDHKKHVDWIKAVNPKAIVSVKVSGASDVDMVAVGSYYAGAHVVHLDGSYGGTGAAPDIAKKNIAMPIEYAIPKVHRFLVEEGVRDNITLIASGGLRTAWDVAKAIALGANAVVIGTAEIVALECIRCGLCESGRGCARGIASTDPELSMLFDTEWAYQRLVNLFNSWAVQLQAILWRLGLRSVQELVGRSDLIEHLDYDNKSNQIK